MLLAPDMPSVNMKRGKNSPVTEQLLQALSNRRPSPALHLFFVLHYNLQRLRPHSLCSFLPHCHRSYLSIPIGFK